MGKYWYRLKPESILPLMYEMKYIVRAGGFPDGVHVVHSTQLVSKHALRGRSN